MRGISRGAARAVVLLAALVALGSPPAAGQETVEFRLRLASGEVFHYTSAATGQFMSQLGNQRQSTTFQADSRQVVRVLGVDDDGTILVELALEDYRITQGGRTLEPLFPPIALKVRPDGKVVERQSGDYAEEDFPFAFPGGPVRVGDSWSRQTRIEELGITGQGSQTLILAGLDRAGDERVARITYRTEGRITGADVGPLPPGAQSRVSGTMRGSGEFLWSVDRGRLLRSTGEVEFEVQVEVSAQGQTVRVVSTFRGMERAEPLPAEQVTVPAIAPEFLIAPGRAVGPLTLDILASDLTSRFGQARAGGPITGLRAPSMIWTDGLTAYVDEADRNKLIALEISDRRYRTEKGIAFGSSQGAVLLAYGMSPARFELSIPNLGGARILIYNDLGIAFALTSDKKHAEAGPGHAPVGAVDWITIFSPGQAGRIYALP